MVGEVTQGEHRRLRPLEEGHAHVGERAHDLGIEVAAGERAEREHQLVGAGGELLVDDAGELTVGGPAARLGHAGAQIDGQDVGAVLPQHAVDQAREERGVLVHGARAVERVARVRELRHERGDPLDGHGRERRQLDPRAIGRVRHATALAAESARDDGAPARARHAPGGRQQGQRVEHLVQARDLHDPALSQQRLDDLRRPRERARVGEHRLPRVLRAADLQRDDGLPARPRARRDLAQLRGPTEALHEHADHLGVPVLDEELHVVLHAQPGLVAARHDVGEADGPLLHQVLGDRVAEPATLRDQRHGARPRRLDEVGAERGGTEPDVEDPVAVRSADQEAALGGEPFEHLLARASVRPGLAEAARQHDRAAHAARRRVRQHRRHVDGRDRDDDGVGRLRYRREVGVAREPEDLRVLGVDREHAPGVAEALEVRDHSRGAVEALRRANHRDAVRLHQRGEIHGVSPGTQA